MDKIIIVLLGLIVIEVSYLVYATKKRHLPKGSSRKVYIDTSALMDGRIVTAARTGFIPDNLIIPTSVVAELQLLADQADSEKRARARRGLDAITELQEVKGIIVTILDDGPLGAGGVDARLVELAKKEPTGFLCTIDFNLNKVATVNDITVLNINELAGSIRMAFLPGETMSLALTQKGQGDNQAVGYLADGTMVVVDKAGKDLGKTVQIEFIRSLQTAAGRMMFARLVSKKQPAKTRGAVEDEGRHMSAKVSGSKPIEDSNMGKQSRKPVTKTSGRKPTESQSKPVKSTQSNQSKKHGRGKRTGSNEDSLLELVNNQ